mgnify:CR=1 FL=1
MSKLATIQRITSIRPIEGADNIEQAQVMGWTVVVEKSRYHEGEKVVFCEIDSLLPSNNPAFSFMEKYKYRVKTIKLRGVVSQGLVFPLNIISSYLLDPKFSGESGEGEDVTDFLQIRKWEKPVHGGGLANRVKFSTFPFFIPKTDEVRIQSALGALEEIWGHPAYMTVKCDGTSMTVGYRNGEFFVCSRNNKIPLEELENDGLYWPIVKKYNLEETLPPLGNIAIQGELVGPGIQKNRLGLDSHDWLVFDVYDIDNRCYYPFKKQQSIIEKLELKAIPIVVSNFFFDFNLEQLLKEANGLYSGLYWKYSLNTKNLREGIVVRPMQEMYSPTLKGRLSFKVIYNKFLLGGGE